MSVAVIIALAFTASVIFQNRLYGNDKYILGFKSFVTLSDSMSPLIQKDSLIIIQRVNTDAIKIGDIITYSEASETLTQRVVEIVDSDDGAPAFITKGDNVEGMNSKPVTPDKIIGGFVYSISHAGSVILALRNPVYMLLCVAGVCAYFIAFDRLSRYARKCSRGKKRRNTRQSGKEIGTPSDQPSFKPIDPNNTETAVSVI
jgi:signal peptidase